MLRVTTHLEMGFLRREAALRESETQLRAILEGALDAVVGMDASGLVIDWNPQAEATFGYTRAEALGPPPGRADHPARACARRTSAGSRSTSRRAKARS